MTNPSSKYRYTIYIRPGIFDDSTYGVYLVPEDNPNVEYQLRSQIKTKDDATKVANKLAQELKCRLEIVSVEVCETRDIKFPLITNGLDKDSIAEMLESHLEKQFAFLSTFKEISWVNAIFKVIDPLLISIGALIVYIFSFSYKFSEDFPVLGWIIGGHDLNPKELALWFPLAILILIILRFVRARILASEGAVAKDYIITLAIKYKWRRSDFFKLYMKVINSEDAAWFFKGMEPMLAKQDSDMVSSILAMYKDSGKDDGDLIKSMIESEDFERKIHALLYLDKEKDYSPYYISVKPFYFMLALRDVKDKLRIELAKPENLPKISREIQVYNAYISLGIFIGIIAPVLLILTAFLGSLYLSWNSPLKVITLNVALGVLSLIILLWHKLPFFAGRLGFPRDHSFYDAQFAIIVD